MNTFRTSIVVPKSNERVFRAVKVDTDDVIESSDLAKLLREIAKDFTNGSSPWLIGLAEPDAILDLIGDEVFDGAIEVPA